MAKGLRLLVSLLILFHLMVVTLVANPDSVMNRRLESVILPYANFLGLNTTWRFFSPNPMMQTVYYEAIGYAESGEVVFQVEERFPSRERDVHSTESMNRMMAAAMFLTARADLVDQLLKPYLCARHPEAQEVYIHNISRRLPSIENASIMGGDRDALTSTEKNVLTTIHCKEKDV